MPSSEKLIRLSFWSVIVVTAFFSLFLFQDQLLTAQLTAGEPEVTQEAAPSLFDLPYLSDSEEQSALMEFLQSFSDQTEEVTNANDALCCNRGSSCSLIGTGYSEERCATEKGRVELCALACGNESVQPERKTVPAAPPVREPATRVAVDPIPLILPEICNNQTDEDRDGLLDSADPDCFSGELPPEPGLTDVQLVLPTDADASFPSADEPLLGGQGVLPLEDTATFPVQDVNLQDLPATGNFDSEPYFDESASQDFSQFPDIVPEDQAFIDHFPQEEVAPVVPVQPQPQTLEEQHLSRWQMMINFLGL